MSDEYLPSPVTPVEILLYRLVAEQKKTNELLQKLTGIDNVKRSRKKEEESK